MPAPSAPFAATLSFVLPGLGQFAEGAWRRSFVYLVPSAAVAATGIVAAAGGTARAVELLLRPEVLAALLALNVFAFLLHALAIFDAWHLGRHGSVGGRRGRRLGTAVVAGLLALTVAAHGVVGYVGLRAYQAFDAMFEPGGGWDIPAPGLSPEPSPSPSASPTASPTPTPRPTPKTTPGPTPASTPSPSPVPTPTATPSPPPTPEWAADGRLDLLLIGSDAGPGRWSLRTDTVIVLSVDVATGRAALFGIPRNLVGVPLPPESAGAFPDGRFPGLLNALYVYAMGHPNAFPGGEARGFRAVTGAVQELVGVRLDGMVGVNLAGFVRLVDAVGGLWIDVPARLVDDRYPLEDGTGLIRIDIPAGCQHLDGRMALAYARSRHQDSDYGRMARQQAVLVALRRQLDPLALLARLPELLGIAEESLFTTLDRDEIGGLAELGGRVEAGAITRVLFVPPRYASRLTTDEIARIRSVVTGVFAGPAPVPGPEPTTPAATCP